MSLTPINVSSCGPPVNLHSFAITVIVKTDKCRGLV